MTEQQDTMPIFLSATEDVPGEVTVMRKNNNYCDQDTSSTLQNQQATIHPGINHVQVSLTNNPNRNDQGDRNMLPLGGSVSSVSQTDLNATTTHLGDNDEEPITPHDVEGDADLNTFFDDDFLLFMSDDDPTAGSLPANASTTVPMSTENCDMPIKNISLRKEESYPNHGADTCVHNNLLVSSNKQKEIHSTPPPPSPPSPVSPLIQEAPRMMIPSSCQDASPAGNVGLDISNNSNPITSNGIIPSNPPAPVSVSSVSIELDQQPTKQTSPNMSSIETVASMTNDSAIMRNKKRKNMTPEQKANGRRERNREHAKRSRKRKKVFVETLQEMIIQLKRENETMRSCMTQHFGSSFVQDLLSTSNGAQNPSSTTSILSTHESQTALSKSSTSSPSSRYDMIYPKPRISSSQSSGNDTSILNNQTSSSSSCQTIQPSTSINSQIQSNYYDVANTSSDVTRWLAEQNTPSYLRRKNIMYKDKLRVLLPKHGKSTTFSTNGQHHQSLLPKKLSSNQGDNSCVAELLCMEEAAGIGSTNANGEEEYVANPIFSSAT